LEALLILARVVRVADQDELVLSGAVERDREPVEERFRAAELRAADRLEQPHCG